MINPEDKKYIDLLNGHKMSQAQIDLCNFAGYGVGNAMIQARAGSGKSKTIELMCASCNPRKKILILSYNRHIANNLKEKLKSNTNIDVYTYHSLGLKILKAKLGDTFKINEHKYNKYITNNLQSLTGLNFELVDGNTRLIFRKNVQELVDYARYNKCQSPDEINFIANKYRINLIHDECFVVKDILKWGSENTNEIDFQDMIWLPYELGIKANIKYLQYDLIFVDEAQDSSLVQQNLIDICKNRATRIFVFGDANQTINGWCGADSEAFEHFSIIDNMNKFDLNVSYRCSKKVADKVRTLIPDFSTPSFAKEGSVNYDVPIKKILPGDMVLCRTTFPLIKMHIELLSRNIPSKVNGLKIGEELIELINSYNCNDVKSIIDSMYCDFSNQWMRIARIYNCDLRSIVNDKQLVETYDKILCIEEMSKGCETKNQLIEKLSTIFIDETDLSFDKNDNVFLSTVHRAKGLECDNVFIICPSLMPSIMAVGEVEMNAEKNIMYVAWSRAKDSLNFVDEKEFSAGIGFLKQDDLYNELIVKCNGYITI